MTVECFVALPLAYTTYAEFVTAGGSASDNCGLVESTFTLVSQTSGAGICPRTVTRTYSIADTCDNVSMLYAGVHGRRYHPASYHLPGGSDSRMFCSSSAGVYHLMPSSSLPAAPPQTTADW